MPFAIPMAEREGKDPIMDCYFCMKNLKEINRNNKHHTPIFLSTIRQILHGSDLPVPDPDSNMENSSDSKHSDMTVVAGNNEYKPEKDDQQVPFTQAELILNG